MILSIIDENGNRLDNLEIFFQYKETKKIFKTDTDGLIEITGLEKGTIIRCHIIENETNSFEFEEDGKLAIAFNIINEDMHFVVARQNGDAANNLEIHFEYEEKKLVGQTDDTGQFVLENIPINTQVKVFQFFKEQEVNVEMFLCERDKAQYFYVADQLFEKATMKLKLVDKNNHPISNSDLRFKLDNKEFETVTDKKAYVYIENIKVGTTVECKQLMFGKSLSWHKFIFDNKKDEYIVQGEKQTPYGSNSEDYSAQTNMKIRLVNSKSEPIVNAIITLHYADKERNKYTNANGEIQIDDAPIGEKLKAFVDVRGNKTEAVFVCSESKETNEIILKTDNGNFFAWLIPLILVVGLLILYSQSNMENLFKKEKKIEPIVVKDTVIINNYQITVKNKNSSSPIKYAKVALSYKDTSYTKYCDSLGTVNFNTRPMLEPIQISASAIGYFNQTVTFKTDSLFTVLLAKNDSVDLGSNNLDCGFLTQSEGSNITYRTFRMKTDKGRFKLFYNMFSLPDQITVYNGAIHEISDKQIIFDSKKMVAGLKTLYVNFESADSLITIKLCGNDKDTKWLYKVFCPKKQYPAKAVQVK